MDGSRAMVGTTDAQRRRITDSPDVRLATIFGDLTDALCHICETYRISRADLQDIPDFSTDSAPAEQLTGFPVGPAKLLALIRFYGAARGFQALATHLFSKAYLLLRKASQISPEIGQAAAPYASHARFTFKLTRSRLGTTSN